jgi:hypothetical protein
MARQSATNPRFRCNGCKDYYSAPEHTVYYQCASHGHLCEKHIVKSGDKYKQAEGDWNYDIGSYNYKKKSFSKNYYGRCNIFNKGVDNRELLSFQKLAEECCLKDPVRFNWHEDVSRWIEKGREKEEKAKAKPKAKSKTKPDYVSEIKVLMDLFEQDILTKEQFLSQLKEKLGL